MGISPCPVITIIGMRTPLCDSLCWRSSAHSRQSNVENKATGNIRPLGAEKFRRGSKPLCVPRENRTPDAAWNRTRQREADGRNRKASIAEKCMDKVPMPIVRDPPTTLRRSILCGQQRTRQDPARCTRPPRQSRSRGLRPEDHRNPGDA